VNPEHWSKAVATSHLNRASHDFETGFRTRSGIVHDALVSLEQIDLEMRPATLALIYDITERKQLEEERLKTELTRVELRKERELIELKERFISMVSHEFRNPLSVILSSSDIVLNYQERLTREKIVDHVRKIHDQSTFMTRLMEDTLTVGQAMAGKLNFDPAPVDLKQFCSALVEEFQLALGTGHVIDYHPSSAPGEVYMDVKLLRHILINLLSNAAKYSPQSEHIDFHLFCLEHDVVFEVRDHGIGIPLKDQSRLFEPFHRAGNTGEIKGTGLGLAIVKDSVELHGGTITFESKEGDGTKFIVRLPSRPH
jgi:signal transduction histidine kinase